MWDWLLKHVPELTALSTVIMAAATTIVAAATAVYAFLTNKSLAQSRKAVTATTLPLLALQEDTFGANYPQLIFVNLKNNGFGPALEIRPEIQGNPVGFHVLIKKRSLGPGDSLTLEIIGDPHKVIDYSGVLRVRVYYRAIFGVVYELLFGFSIDSRIVALIRVD